MEKWEIWIMEYWNTEMSGSTSVFHSSGLHPQLRQLSSGVNPKLRRDSGAMEFYRALVDAEVVGDLLVQPSPHDVLEHLKFAWRERGERRTQRFQPGTFGALACIARERTLHGVDQFLLRRQLREKIFRTSPHHLHSGRNIPMTAEKDDWQHVPRLR